MKFYLLILIYSLWGLEAAAQISVDSLSHEIAFLGNPRVLAQRADFDSSLEQVQTGPWRNYDSTFVTNPHTAVWLRFVLQNSSPDTVSTYFYVSESFVTLFQKHKQEMEVHKNGLMVPFSNRSNKEEWEMTKIKVSPFATDTLYAKLARTTYAPLPHFPRLLSEVKALQVGREINQAESQSIGFLYFYIAALTTIFCFALVFWIRVPRKLYLYYLGYLLFQIIYGIEVLSDTSAPMGNVFSQFPLFSNALREPLQFVFIGFYVLFILNLLTIKHYDSLLAKILYILGISCFVYALFRFLFTYFLADMEMGGYIFLIVRLIILPVNFILIFWIIYKVKHPLINYFIVGQSFFFVGAVLASYIGLNGLHFVPGHFFNFVAAPNIVFQLGLLGEVFCFSLALGENVLLLQREKDMANTALINQYQKNRMLQEKMNKELDQKVNQKTEELIQLYTQIEKEKEAKIKEDFTHKLKSMEMLALRSQMNPHFLFNSLNAIKHMLMTSRNDEAMGYFDDFSSLLRGILQNSNREIVSVAEELEILELYLNLEKSRIGENFDYSIIVTDRGKLSQYDIPPLLLQPFAENAIWHGLTPSEKADRKLLVVFDTDSEGLKIIMEDNGIGRKASRKIRSLHKSRGLEITRERLALYNYLNAPSIRLQITDLEENGRALGTRITLTYTN